MQGKAYIQDIELAARYGVHRTTPWRWAQAGQFPQPVKLSPGCTRWRVEDIERWEAGRGAE